MTVHRNYHETVDAATRKQMLEEYRHQCQGCGREGPGAGGEALLHVHHIERDPEECDVHAPENLTVLCRQCHFWQHQRPTGEDAPAQVRLSEADHQELLAKDIEILGVLAEQGPARTGEIADALTSEPSVMTTRERLWTLMGLDNIVDERDAQLVDQDVNTGEWGLPGQIELSARGHVPDDPQVLLQRITDEQVRQALDRGTSRQTVVEAFGIARRTSFYKQKRARAYDFPLDAFDNDAQTSPDTTAMTASGSPSAAEIPAGQQRLDTLTDAVTSAGDGTRDADGAASVPTRELVADDESDSVAEEQPVVASSSSEGDAQLRAHLQQAINALEEVNKSL
jgi:hypothetical protein